MFKQALIAASKKLSSLVEEDKLSAFALIGGYALSAYIEPRATEDIDFVIQRHSLDLNAIAKALKGKAHAGDVLDPLRGSISFQALKGKRSVPIQLIEFHPGIEQIAFENIDFIKMGGIKIPLVNRLGLIVLKLYAGGPTDLTDAKKLLQSFKIKRSETRYLETQAKRLRLLHRLNKVL